MTDDDKALAGEFVLRVLEPAEEAQVRARIATDSTFAAEVAAWEERLQGMHSGQESAPSDLVWPRIANAIATENVANDRGASGRLRIWQGLTATATAAAVLFAVILYNRPTPAPSPADTPLIAALGSETGRASMTASYDRVSGTLTITPVALDTGKLFPELWVVPADGKARSLGMVKSDKPMQVNVDPAMRAYLSAGSTLAITPEPASGAPGGVATGPIIASGKITAL